MVGPVLSGVRREICLAGLDGKKVLNLPGVMMLPMHKKRFLWLTGLADRVEMALKDM